MKKLLILAFIVASCGYVKVPLFEQHMDDDDKKDNPTMIHASKPLLCSQESFNHMCTNFVVNRVLLPNEFYSPNCHSIYRDCLVRRY